ncbi:YjjG family noncanonical pyrimidine nucleotidase [Tenacibaculum jejuense]|uniref:Haloacid dehalogenase-like hydrolase n=1 Tax=Tenacibaculum jejuense TaxID=584609 RepID=A0A238UET9_9FLAO|nr:YjjG family noncanonical pyrimidine nucleotidase [Tenacibaculum jejuense]SNR17098.1 Haloacid dehalogenase-like hydrolase [Tenacibaculum jejuense]
MTGIAHIFFDLDHTLWDFDQNSSLTFQQIFKEQNITLDLNEFLEVYIPLNLQYWKLYREEKIAKEELRYRRLKDVFDTLNFNASDALIDQVSEDYIKYLSDYNFLIDGTLEILEYLKPKYKLHIITNGFKEVQHKKLMKSGIRDFFDLIVTSESVGVKKPNPKIFNFALKEVNSKPENCIMVGDSLEADVMGAKNLGIQPIFYDPKQEETVENNVLTIRSLLEIKQFL